MHTKQKAIRNFTKEEIEPLRKQGLIFKITDIFSDEYKIIDGLRYAEREFCKAKKIDTAKFLRAKKLYRQNGIKSLLGLFRKYRIKKPISQEIIDMFEKNMSN